MRPVMLICDYTPDRISGACDCYTVFTMFGDIFGVTASEVNQSNQAHAVNYLTLTLLLIEKGIITDDEIERARTQATHFVEQEWARKKEEAAKDFDEQHPGVRKMFGSVLGDDTAV